MFAQAANNPPDLGVYVQDLFQSLIGVDVAVVLRFVAIWVFLIWFVFALWVAFDAAARYKQWPVAVVWFLFVLPFNVFGFIGYLFMRPVVTLEEKQWTKLESKYLMHELSSVNDCPSCGTLIPTTQNFCAACGTQMNVNCPKCESLQSIYNSFCSGCGSKLTPEPREIPKEEVVAAPPKQKMFDKIGSIVLQAKSAVTGVVSAAKKKSESKKNKQESAEKKS
jgi:uncharacterized OB-fold protein